MNGLISTYNGHWENDDYVFFWGGPFSNWYFSKFYMYDEDNIPVEFNCSEQAMMYMKAKLFGDTESASNILKEHYPDNQKRLGKLVKNFDEIVWLEHRERIAHEFLLEKFMQNVCLKTILLASGNKTIVEASPYDKIWGIGMGTGNNNILNESKWNGLNLLGKCLMYVRETIREQEL